jgi:hypothetical protein
MMVTVDNISERAAVRNAVCYMSRDDGKIDVYQDGDITPERLQTPAFAYPSAAARTITPEQYGAHGNGVSDDSDAIQQAVDAWLGSAVKLSNGVYRLGSLSLTQDYRITRMIIISAAVSGRNYFGGKISGGGSIRCDTGGIGLSVSSHMAGWQGLTIRGLMFVDCPVEVYAMGPSAAMYGALFSRLMFRANAEFALPAFRMGSVFESSLTNSDWVWSSETEPCILAEHQAGSLTTASSLNFTSCNTRGGKHGIYVKGYWSNPTLVGGAYLYARHEGVRCEANRAFVSGSHFENNCQTDGDCGIKLLGNGVITGIGASQNGGSMQKYPIRAYAADPVVIVGGNWDSIIQGSKFAVLDGDGGTHSKIKLIGVKSYDAFGGAVGNVTSG